MFESKGLKRTLASVFAVVAFVAPAVPVLAPFSEVFSALAAALGGAGLLHAGAIKLVK